MTIQQNNSDGQDLFATGFNSDAVMKDIHSAASISVDATTNTVYRYNGAFGRINYNRQDKYIVNLTARRDGSSRFGAESQFHNFAAAGAAWIFSQEEFIRENLRFLSFGKLRGSYGTTGNDQIANYSFMNLYNSTGNSGVAYQGSTGLLVNGIPNPYLQWEDTKKLQVGIDLGLFKDRILLTGNYVYNRSSNQLLPYALPTTTGSSSITTNFPAVIQNTAWEFSLNTTNVKSGKLTWTSSFILTIPKNKLVSFPNLATSTYASTLVIGQPLSITKVYHFLGVDPATGRYTFADRNGNPTSSPSNPADKTVLINILPKYYGGLQNTFSYKGFQLDFLFQFVKQIGSDPGSFGGSTFLPGTKFYNQTTVPLNRWQKPGDITFIQRYSSNTSLSQSYSNALSSDAVYSDAVSFIRLKNLSLSYQLPEKWQQQVRLRNCRLYMQCQNLLTITKYHGFDPETKGFSSLPPLRVVTFGLQVGL